MCSTRAFRCSSLNSSIFTAMCVRSFSIAALDVRQRRTGLRPQLAAGQLLPKGCDAWLFDGRPRARVDEVPRVIEAHVLLAEVEADSRGPGIVCRLLGAFGR